jgi:hypothetical protein
VTFGPVALEFDIEALSLFLHLGSLLLAMGQAGAESIQLVVQGDQLIDQIVFHLARFSRWHMLEPRQAARSSRKGQMGKCLALLGGVVLTASSKLESRIAAVNPTAVPFYVGFSRLVIVLFLVRCIK